MLSERKKALMRWAGKYAQENRVFLPSLRMQKFLFFYECFSKVEGDEYDFDNLKGYKLGPVFGDVYTAMKHYPHTLLIDSEAIAYPVNDERAMRALFLVRALGNDLSEFTHNLDIWKTKEQAIIGGGYQIPLSVDDFSQDDEKTIKSVSSIYNLDYISNVKLEEVSGKTFIIPKNLELTEEHYDAFYAAATDSIFKNPVYVSVHEGDLCLE